MNVHELTDDMKARIDKFTIIASAFTLVLLMIFIFNYVTDRRPSLFLALIIPFLFSEVVAWKLFSHFGLRPYRRNYDNFMAVERIVRVKVKKKKEYMLYLESIDQMPSNDVCCCEQGLFESVSPGDRVLVLCHKTIDFNFYAYSFS